MKYVIFVVFAACVVPAIAYLTARSSRWKRAVLMLLALSPALGAYSNVHFWSMEEYRGPDRGFEVTLTDLLVAGLAGSVLARGRRRIEWLPPNTLPLLALAACCIVSAASTPVPLYSMFTIFKLARCGLLYWVLVNSLSSREDAIALLRGFVAAGLVITVVAAAQKYLLGVYRVPGPFDHSNTLPLYANLVIAPLLIRAMADEECSGVERVLTVSAVLGMMCAVTATFSRAGIVLSVAGFLAAMLVAIGRSPRPRSLRLAALVVALVAAAGLRAAPSIVERFTEASHGSEGARNEFNVAAQLMAAEYPFGVGPNAFSAVMSSDPRFWEHVKYMARERSAGVAHHIYWLTAAELGYGGLAVFVVVLLGFLRVCARVARRPRSLETLLALGVAIGMVCVHLHGLLEWALRITPVLYQFMMVAALAVSVSRATRPLRGSREYVVRSPAG